MDRFETQFENLDVQTQVMDSTMANSSTLSTPQGEVDNLMAQVADEAGYVHPLIVIFFFLTLWYIILDQWALASFS